MQLGWLVQLRFRIKSLWKRGQLDRDLDDELAFHVAMREKRNRAAGLDATEARHAARRNLGNTTALKESTRQMWTFTPLKRSVKTSTSALAC